MGWAAIISAIISIFGPMLAEWLKKWLDSRLADVSQSLPAAESFGSPDLARAALFDAAIDSLPRWAFARRALLRRMKAHGDGPVTGEAAAEFRDLAGSAAGE